MYKRVQQEVPFLAKQGKDCWEPPGTSRLFRLIALPHLPTTARMDYKYDYIIICSILAASGLMSFWQKISLSFGEFYSEGLA